MKLATQALFPKAVLIELALGLDKDTDIALRHKLTDADIAWARTSHAAEIAKMAAELRDMGFSFKRKNALVAEDLIPLIFAKAMQPDIGVGSLLDIYRTVSKYGELEPKENLLVPGGGSGGFSINIVVNGQSVTKTKQADIVEHTPYVPPSFDELAALAPPKFLDSADLSVNDELMVGVGDLHPLVSA